MAFKIKFTYKMLLIKTYGYQILFFILSLILFLKDFIFGNDDKKEDKVENKNKEAILNLTKEMEEMKRSNKILIINNEQIIKDNEQVIKDNEQLKKNNE